MDIRQLTYFLGVAEMQSLSRAASVLRVAQPALSRQIKALEEELGAQLLSRHGWGVTPTSAGRILMEHARRVVKEVNSARDAVQAFQSEPSGKLRFGVPTSLGGVLLTRLAQSFRRQFPKVMLHLVEGFSASIHEWLLSGRLDIAVLYETKAMGSVGTTPLLEEDMVVVGTAGQFPPDSRLPLHMLPSLGLILPARPHRLRMLVDDAYAAQGLTVEPIIEVDALPTIIELVRVGEGCTVLPFSAVHHGVAAGVLSYAEMSPTIGRRLLLARPVDVLTTPASEALEEQIIEFITVEAPALRWRPVTLPKAAENEGD